MIKVDIVNEVSKIADITKVKAEVAVDAVFDAMRLSMQRGDPAPARAREEDPHSHRTFRRCPPARNGRFATAPAGP